MGAREAHAADDDASLEQFADAVADRHFVDLDQGMAVAPERDLPELEAAQQGTFEPADAERRGQVLVRLPDDEVADAVLGPTGFDDGNPDQDEGEDDCDEADRRFCQRCGNRTGAAKA